jgi:hypothetical protein
MEDARYEDWRRRRGEAPAPDGFADRVMAAVAGEQVARPQRAALLALWLALWNARLGRIGVCSLAAAVCVLRLAHVVAIFVAQ